MSDLLELSAQRRAQRNSLFRKIEAARQERDALETAPMPKADVLLSLDRAIAKCHEEFERNLRIALERLRHRPTVDFASLRGGFPFLVLMDGHGNIDQNLIVSLLTDSLRSRCRAVVESMTWTDAGPPMKERDRLRASLDRQIEADQESLALLDAELRAAGINP